MCKKLFLICSLLTSIMAFSQENNPYVSVSLYTSRLENFVDNSFFSAEIGVARENINLGITFGRNLGTIKNSLNYWYGGRFKTSQRINIFYSHILLGVGQYIQKNAFFLEYGVSISKNLNCRYIDCNKIAIFAEIINRNNTTFVGVGINYSLFNY